MKVISILGLLLVVAATALPRGAQNNRIGEEEPASSNIRRLPGKGGVGGVAAGSSCAVVPGQVIHVWEVDYNETMTGSFSAVFDRIAWLDQPLYANHSGILDMIGQSSGECTIISDSGDSICNIFFEFMAGTYSGSTLALGGIYTDVGRFTILGGSGCLAGVAGMAIEEPDTYDVPSGASMWKYTITIEN